MRPVRTAVVAALALGSPVIADPAPAPPLYGFSSAHAAAQWTLEARFAASLRAEDQRAWMERLTARPHPVGSPWGKENAEFMAGLFRSWGFDTHIEEFRVLFPTPKLRRLEMLAPIRFTAALAEPPLAGDRTSAQTAEQLPPYNAYSPDGDVTGDLVYVNFGLARDYAELERRGIAVEGKIVLARYGRSWRGLKPKLAAEHGAVGCILFSDPHEDGYFQGDPYPAGGFRPEQGVQRGAVSDDWLYPGDPLTPFVGAVPEAKRLALADVKTFPRIPVLPISWGDALPLLRALEGPVAPEDWRGALPLTYHIGPGPARVHLTVAFDRRLVPAYDVIARLPGAERPDEWVLRGNHHDAWVSGAEDPVSALVAMLAEAKAVGELARSGWRPKRTILYAAWDGEEPGLLGSVEWAETHAAELAEHLAAYVNSDSNARGFVWISGVSPLATLVDQVCRDVVDPEKGVSVAARARADALLEGSPEEQRLSRAGKPLPLKPLGPAIDYTSFLAFLGIPVLDISYGGEEEYGQYHSAYDSFDHFTRFVDPGFRYGVALAETGGRLMLRLADADVLPLDFVPFAEDLGKAIQEVERQTDAMREEAAETNRRIADKTYELAADPLHPVLAPKPREPVPALDLAPLQKAVARLAGSARAYAAAMTQATGAGFPLPAGARQELAQILLRAERVLTRSEGLPHRPWYRHALYGPISSTGRMATFPGVREAIERGDWPEAAEQITAVARVIESYAQQVDRATAALASRTASADGAG
ncbi:MAG TPA: transferrin receptor-like dimerization domain-containing protein [Thermoanaerobaculia bacterium]|jgi:N-acetylated-alpha-linked acidic dipeptidase|nr:transferrin receptor-like dimerization domain-containing protein [Thermoanaerobaculia bacterium]